MLENFIEHLYTAINTNAVSEQSLSSIKPEMDIDKAYAVQDLISQKQIASGKSQIGWKIALTNSVAQQRFSMTEPVFAPLFSTMQKGLESPVAHPNPLAVHVEGELAFVFGQDCPPDCVTPVQLVHYLSDIKLGFEFASRRIQQSFNIVDLIADNAAGYCFVLSKRSLDPKQFDFSHCTMKMIKSDNVVSRGTAADVLGNPLNSVLWLVKKLAVFGKTIRAGDVVLSGSMCIIPNALPGENFTLVLCDKCDDVLDSVRMGFK